MRIYAGVSVLMNHFKETHGISDAMVFKCA